MSCNDLRNVPAVATAASYSADGVQFLSNFIDGKFVAPVASVGSDTPHEHYLENRNPATYEILSLIPRSGEKDVEAAVAAADRALQNPAWRDLTVDDRSRLLNRIADCIESNLESLALEESLDTGKTISFARMVDIPRAAKNFRFFASLLTTSCEHAMHMPPDAINYTSRSPVGVVGLITPWNLPLYLLSWKLGPALAMGNTIVMKCSEMTPTTATSLCRLFTSAGLPSGVVNLVHGYGSEAGQYIIEHPKVSAVSFTGGTSTGRHVARTVAPMFKKLSLELGGSNAAIVFDDCDLERSASEAVRGGFANQGQVCLCLKRVLVQRTIFEQFKILYIQKAQEMNASLGDPQNPTTKMGAMISCAQRKLILDYIEQAKQDGGVILCGGQVPDLPEKFQNGAFLQCTVVEGLHPSTSRVCREEIFGPMTVLIPFDTEDEALELANGTMYGLCCSVFTSNLPRAHRVAKKVNVGTVWINTWLHRDLRVPFGGTKASGVEREGGEWSLRFYSEEKNICIKF